MLLQPWSTKRQQALRASTKYNIETVKLVRKLFVQNNLSHSKIANKLKIPVGTIHTMIHAKQHGATGKPYRGLNPTKGKRSKLIGKNYFK